MPNKFNIKFELFSELKSKDFNALLEKYLKSIGTPDEILNVFVRQVERVGWSNSDVYYIDISLTNFGGRLLQNVGKFMKVNKAKREYEHAQPFKRKKDVDITLVYGDKLNEYALVVYQKVEDSKEFRDLYLDKNIEDNVCANCITSLYDDIVSKYIVDYPGKNEARLRSIIQDYGDYLEKRKSKPLQKLRSVVDFFEQARTYGAENPYTFYLDELKATRWGARKIVRHLIHGDLHARNIMVNKETNLPSRLIDYAWGHYGHRAKDFTLLEATIKYMLLTEYTFRHKPEGKDDLAYIPHEVYMGFEKQLCVEGMNLSEYRFESGELRSGHEFLEQAIQRAFTCIRAIRESAEKYLDAKSANKKEYGDDINFFENVKEEYFTSLFLVSLGNAAYPQVEENWVLHGCGLLIPEIKKYWVD